jgi:monofunctional biosynthetic peptidoglycan transglycosylase
MEVYLNVIETGKGIYGVEAASRSFFEKSAANITRGEAALIAAVLPNPLKWNPAAPTPYIRGRQQWILWNMSNIGSLRY